MPTDQKTNQQFSDAMTDLEEAINDFQNNPNESTMDDIYHMTGEIERLARETLAARKQNQTTP